MTPSAAGTLAQGVAVVSELVRAHRTNAEFDSRGVLQHTMLQLSFGRLSDSRHCSLGKANNTATDMAQVPKLIRCCTEAPGFMMHQ